MTRISMKTIKQLNEKDLKKKVQDTRGELTKLRVDAAKGTLRKESGKLKPLRRDIARMLTRINEMSKQK
ncbi:MAG: 50S ribosomal protein L29 [Nitrosopumilus sp.]|nr:50S ribosomal protein L29 [Nitrosopumilus sp.]MDH3515201.1 50S ribosomal protein L29 [Nitrosopumilus sp.]MDH3564498.1 50S ribosomal protein L29 [Nitrosopumilus sp.]MDH5418605.1 50S ribosomal protein L29 [Nitrosopumilus sp.]MDH5554294.1 50S ribosomal protein L29 [Nitrosopumilus sp.]